VGGEVLPTEGSDLEIILDDEGSVKTLNEEEKVISEEGRRGERRDRLTPKTPMRMKRGSSK